MKFGIKSYYSPTPKKLRKIGDALLGSSQFITGYCVIMEEKYLALVCIILGTIGKFMTNLYSEDNDGKNT